jgi:hypothetical protein
MATFSFSVAARERSVITCCTTVKAKNMPSIALL